MTLNTPEATNRLVERMIAIADRDDTTGLAADALREGSEQITALKAEIARLREAAVNAQKLVRACEGLEWGSFTQAGWEKVERARCSLEALARQPQAGGHDER